MYRTTYPLNLTIFIHSLNVFKLLLFHPNKEKLKNLVKQREKLGITD
jgi:hypothetical protein